MTVRELIAELQGLDPDAEVRFFHLRRVLDDGSGRVDSYPVLEAAEGDDGEVTLSDFLVDGPALYRVRRREWPEQPALGPYEPDEPEEPGPEPGGLAAADQPLAGPVDTLLLDPPFSREE